MLLTQGPFASLKLAAHLSAAIVTTQSVIRPTTLLYFFCEQQTISVCGFPLVCVCVCVCVLNSLSQRDFLRAASLSGGFLLHPQHSSFHCLDFIRLTLQ